MKRFSIVIYAAFVAVAPFASAQSYQAGMTTLEVQDPTGRRDLEGLLWYPTEADGPVDVDFESKVWVSNTVIKDATPINELLPLIVVSHGMFGNAYNQAWFSAEMARRGYAVAAINHPGTSTWLRDPDQRRALWERPKDISRVIDVATSPEGLPVRIDDDRIFMAGHSLGGFTALVLAGARFDKDHLDRFCDSAPGELTCGIFADWEIANTRGDRAEMEADLSDPRIRAFALFDLGGTQGFDPESITQIIRPMLVFGAPVANSGLTLDVESRALVAALPSETVRYIEPSTLSHFDFLGQCKPGGYELLAKEEPGDEIICDNGGNARAAKHQMIVDEVTRFIEQR